MRGRLMEKLLRWQQNDKLACNPIVPQYNLLFWLSFPTNVQRKLKATKKRNGRDFSPLQIY